MAVINDTIYIWSICQRCEIM